MRFLLHLRPIRAGSIWPRSWISTAARSSALRFSRCRAIRTGRLGAVSLDPPRQSRENCGAMRPPAAAVGVSGNDRAVACRLIGPSA